MSTLFRQLGLGSLMAISFFYLQPSVYACGGSLQTYENNRPREKWKIDNWKVANPQVVVAFGYMEEPVVKRYSHFVKPYFEKHLKKVIPHVQIRVIERATSQDVIDSLMNKDTVGFVFMSHTFKTESTDGAVAILADGHPLPPDFLSAATPALRYASIFGCNGPNIAREYQVEYEFDKIPGTHVFYSNKDRALSAGCMGIDNLKILLKKEVSDLVKNHQGLFNSGIESDDLEDALLTVRAKDVFPGMEPRYVHVNGNIVGVLGSDLAHSSQSQGYNDFHYVVPARALRDEDGSFIKRHTIKVNSADISPHALVDNYLIESVTLKGSQGETSHLYSPPWHMGNRNPVPPQVSDVSLLKKAMGSGYTETMQELIQKWESNAFLDRDQSVWDRSIFKGRFYIDHLQMNDIQ